MDDVVRREALLHDFGDERIEENQSESTIVHSTIVSRPFRKGCGSQPVHEELRDLKLVSFESGLNGCLEVCF
eukprot:247565-Rhodomonas_salina.1